MLTRIVGKSLAAIAILLTQAVAAPGQSPEAAIVNDATAVLNEIMAIPARQIPQSMLATAHGVAIIPNVVKGGLIVGVRYGRGVAVIRDEQGVWQPPTLVTFAGGSVGWQVGVQATDVVLVFRTRKSVQGLLQGKFTVGADAAVAAGPVGRQAAAATDARLQAEILSYSRSRGLFAGVSLDGSSLQSDPLANAAYYAVVGSAGQPAGIPESAVRLLETLTRYSGGGLAAAGAGPPPAVAPVEPQPAATRRLAAASLKLQQRLDDTWKRYLALPTEVYAGDRPPSADRLREALARYDNVQNDPRYASLASSAEFRETHAALKQLLADTPQVPRQQFQLPAPPAE